MGCRRIDFVHPKFFRCALLALSVAARAQHGETTSSPASAEGSARTSAWTPEGVLRALADPKQHPRFTSEKELEAWLARKGFGYDNYSADLGEPHHQLYCLQTSNQEVGRRLDELMKESDPKRRARKIYEYFLAETRRSLEDFGSAPDAVQNFGSRAWRQNDLLTDPKSYLEPFATDPREWRITVQLQIVSLRKSGDCIVFWDTSKPLSTKKYRRSWFAQAAGADADMDGVKGPSSSKPIFSADFDEPTEKSEVIYN